MATVVVLAVVVGGSRHLPPRVCALSTSGAFGTSFLPNHPCLPASPTPSRPTCPPAQAGMESSLALTGSQPNNLTYSAAIIACARLADWQRALELKDQMLARWVDLSLWVAACCECSRPVCRM